VTPDLRRQAIERRLAEDPSVSQQQLAAELGTSQKTISRDVEERAALAELIVEPRLDRSVAADARNSGAATR
jgi:DeoR/GlpR family transcriptional regulator of sugar metabolism